MVQCKKCKESEVEPEFTDPYESGLRSRKGGYPILTGFILPSAKQCNTCDNKVQVSGWFEKDPYV